MLKEKIYENILWAKEVMSELDNIPDPQRPGTYFSWTENVACGKNSPSDIFNLWPQLNWGQKMALITVLVTGIFREYDNFIMPATKDCMNNYKEVVHAYTHGRRLRIYVSGYTDESGCFTHGYPDYTVDIRTGRAEEIPGTEYWEEH